MLGRDDVTNLSSSGSLIIAAQMQWTPPRGRLHNPVFNAV